jgi:hypothetical protein
MVAVVKNAGIDIQAIILAGGTYHYPQLRMVS